MRDRPSWSTDGPLGLFTDMYELRMAQTYLRNDMTAPATFSLYIRPDRARPWLMAAGIDRALDVLDAFRYGSDEIDHLAETADLGDDFLGWLAELEITGVVHAVPDGTVVLGDEPLLEFTGPLPVGQLLETALMNVVHLSTVVATKAARCVIAAQGRELADFGARRAHGLEASLEAARAAFLAGVDATSNVEAGRRFGIPVVGTMAHAFVQAFEDEREAFRAFAADHPGHSVMLVDTYDTIEGVRRAIDVGHELRARGADLAGVRLDSGDLGSLARESRRLLDDAGFPDARIMASGAMDEWRIAELVGSGAPIDAFGVGTSVVTSRDHPASDIAYKLVEYDGQAKAKYSTGKSLLPGAKQVYRGSGPHEDVLGRRDDDVAGAPLLRPCWRDGQRTDERSSGAARELAADQLAALPEDWRRPDGPDEVPVPDVSPALRQLAVETRREQIDGSGAA